MLQIDQLQDNFKIQHPGAALKPEFSDVYFHMKPLSQHEISNLYESSITRNNKGTAKFLEAQWVKSCEAWEGIEDKGAPVECTEAKKRELFRKPPIRSLIEEILGELERLSRDQLGLQEKN